MKRNKMRLGALGAAAALTAMSIAPAMGAEVVSQASASAITIGIAGNGTDSGRVTATNDGSGETKEGQVNPPISVLQPNDLLNLGVLAQDAAAQVQDGDGVSAACAGVAGPGGAVAEIGDSNCIFPGDEQIGLELANLDLTDSTIINPESALGPLNELAEPLRDAVLGPVTAALADALGEVGGLSGSFDAISARCTATPGAAEGSSTLVDTQLTVNVGGEEIVLATLPVNPEPNEQLVITDLDVTVAAIVAGVEQTLRDSLTGALAPLADEVLVPIREAIIEDALDQLTDGLQPLEQIVSGTLNKQTSTGPGQIEVTALELQVLPAAAEFADGPLINLEIANVTCGPNSTLAPPPGGPGPDPVDETPAEDLPEIPTVVDSGTTGGANSPAFVAGLLMLMGAAAMVGYRRLLLAGK